MLVLWGTVPIEGMGLTEGRCAFVEEQLTVGTYRLPKDMVMLGTVAMISAATVTSKALGAEPPYAVIAGDIGEGNGSRELYSFLVNRLSTLKAKVVTMHYILPLRDPFEKFLASLEHLSEKPILIGDAGTMLIAKATRACRSFRIFTPDPGEISFLADPEADHPAYVQHYFFEIDSSQVPELAKQAYDLGNAPPVMLIKGAVDYIVKEGQVVGVVSEPMIPSLEPIGGTGDALTGIVSAMIDAGFEPVQACIYGAKVNRMAGALAKPTPATKISEIVPHIPAAWQSVSAEMGITGQVA